MKYSRHQGQGGKAKEDPHPQRNKNCLLNNRTEGATFVRFGAHNFRLTPVIAPVFHLPAGGKIKKDRRGRRRSLGKEWRRVWKMCPGFLCVPLINMQAACQKNFGDCAMKRSGFPPARQALPVLLSGHPEFRGFALTDTSKAAGERRRTF